MVLMMTYTEDSSPPGPRCQPLEPQVRHMSTSCGADFRAGDSCTDGAVGQVRHLYLAIVGTVSFAAHVAPNVDGQTGEVRPWRNAQRAQPTALLDFCWSFQRAVLFQRFCWPFFFFLKLGTEL